MSKLIKVMVIEILTSPWGVVLDVAVFLCHLAFCVTFELMISYQKFVFNL